MGRPALQDSKEQGVKVKEWRRQAMCVWMSSVRDAMNEWVVKEGIGDCGLHERDSQHHRSRRECRRV